MLKGLEDVSRLVQKLTLGRGDSDDLLGIRKTVLGWNQILQRLRFEKDLDMSRDSSADENWRNIDLLLSHTSDLSSLAKRIISAVDAYDFDRKERLATGTQVNDDGQEESEQAQAFGRPPYGGRWKIKPQLVSILTGLALVTPRRFSNELARLHTHLMDMNRRKERLEKQLQEQYGKCHLCPANHPRKPSVNAVDRCSISYFENITFSGLACSSS